jgi:hypothetical protein
MEHRHNAISQKGLRKQLAIAICPLKGLGR